MDPRLWEAFCLLAKRACRDREDHNRADNRGEDVYGRAAWCFLLLLQRLRGPEQSQVHLPHIGCPTRAEAPRISFDIRQIGPVGSRSCPRVFVWPDEQVDSSTAREISHFYRPRD